MESHNALGVGERYHSFLRRIYRRVRADHPSRPVSHALSLDVSAMNQTAGPSGLLPMLLVFGLVPRMPVSPVDLPKQKQRLLAMRTARDEMRRRLARDRLRTALRTRVPPASELPVATRMSVLVCREKPINRWVGPFTVVNTDGKVVWLDVDGQVKQYAIDKVKQYRDSVVSSVAEHRDVPTSAVSSTTPAPQSSSEPVFAVREIGDEDLDTLMDAMHKGNKLLDNIAAEITRFAATPRAIEPSAADHKEYITEVLKEDDLRILSDRFQTATQAEVDG